MMPSDNTRNKYLIDHVKTEITYAYFLEHVKEKRNCLPMGYLKVMFTKNLPPKPVIPNQGSYVPPEGST
jgi:hypothetical protein